MEARSRAQYRLCASLEPTKRFGRSRRRAFAPSRSYSKSAQARCRPISWPNRRRCDTRRPCGISLRTPAFPGSDCAFTAPENTPRSCEMPSTRWRFFISKGGGIWRIRRVSPSLVRASRRRTGGHGPGSSSGVSFGTTSQLSLGSPRESTLKFIALRSPREEEPSPLSERRSTSVTRRKTEVERRSDNGDGSSSLGDRSAMNFSVDSLGEPRDNCEVVPNETPDELPGPCPPVLRRLARTNDGDTRRIRQIPPPLEIKNLHRVLGISQLLGVFSGAVNAQSEPGNAGVRKDIPHGLRVSHRLRFGHEIGRHRAWALFE